MNRTLPPAATRPGARPAFQPGTFFQSLAEQLEEAVLVVLPGSGLCQYANLPAAELTGYSRDELTRLSLAELIAVADAPDALEQIHSALGGPVRTLLDVPLRTRSGTLCPADLRLGTVGGATPLRRDVERPALLVLARPAALRTARELEESQRNRSWGALRRLASFLPNPEPVSLPEVLEQCAAALEADATALYRVTTDPPGVTLAAAVNLPSDFPAQLSAADAQACLQPMSWQPGQRPDSALARAARSAGWSALAAHPLSDGHESFGLILAGYRPGRSAPQSAEPMMAVVANLVWSLLTHQVRAQARRRVETHAAGLARQLESILEATADGVVMLDSEGLVVEINAAGQRMLGYRTEEVAGSPAEDILVSTEPISDEIDGAVSLGRPAPDREVHLVSRDGHQFPARLRVLPLFEGAGEHSGAAAVITDLTDIKSFEAQSQHLEQRATLGDMSAIFAHEIRNPLNGISTGLELLSMRLPEGDPLRDNVAKMQAESSRIDRLLRNSLVVVKPDQFKFEPVEADKLVDRILLRFGPRLSRRKIEVSRHFVPNTPPALMDPRAMEHVIVNLLENAMQAMGDAGGNLYVNVGPAGKTLPPAPLKTDGTGPLGKRGADQDYVQIDIGDSGPGIPPDVVSRIFEPFVTTKPEGTGLGLTIAKRFVHVHRGVLSVQSWPNVGTVFTILLPVARPS